MVDFQYKASEESLFLPAKISYVIHKNENILGKVYDEFEKYRLLLIDTYGKKDKDGKPILNKEGKYEIELEDKFQKEFLALCNRETTVDLHKFLKIEEQIEQISGNQNTLSILWNIIDTVNNVNTPQKIVKKVTKKAVKKELVNAE